MDKDIVDLLWKRLDKLEHKLDIILEARWKLAGGTIVAGLVLTAVFQICLAFIERH